MRTRGLSLAPTRFNTRDGIHWMMGCLPASDNGVCFHVRNTTRGD